VCGPGWETRWPRCQQMQPNPSRNRLTLRRAGRVCTALALLLGLSGVLRGWVYETQQHVVGQQQTKSGQLTSATLAAARTFPPIPRAIPVVNFHDLNDSTGPYAVRPAAFADQIAALDVAGFRTVRLRDVESLVAGRPVVLPPKPLLLAFDDGFASAWTIADRILARHHYNAVAFLITGRLLPGYTVSSVLSAAEIEEMRHSGRWEFGGHTDALHHRGQTASTGLEPALVNRLIRAGGGVETLAQWRGRVDSDLRRSQETMRRLTGAPAFAFSFPYGASDRSVTDPRIPREINRLLAAQGYRLAFNAENVAGAAKDLQLLAVQPGLDPLRLPGLAVTAGETPSDVLTALRSVVPETLPATIAPLHWHASGGRCRPGPHGTLRLITKRYVSCTSDAQALSWRYYRLDVYLAGVSASCTALVSVHESHTVLSRGRLEVALGASRVTIRDYQGGSHSKLAERLLPNRPTSSVGVLHLRLDLSGGALTVRVDGQWIASVPIGANISGAPAFAAACHAPAPGLAIRSASLQALRGRP
jgi:biofilm PGA synthesis lipoprotein PgaB